MRARHDIRAPMPSYPRVRGVRGIVVPSDPTSTGHSGSNSGCTCSAPSRCSMAGLVARPPHAALRPVRLIDGNALSLNVNNAPIFLAPKLSAMYDWKLSLSGGVSNLDAGCSTVAEGLGWVCWDSTTFSTKLVGPHKGPYGAGDGVDSIHQTGYISVHKIPSYTWRNGPSWLPSS